MIALVAGLIGMLPAYAPLFIQLGLGLINLFTKNQAQKDANTQSFLQALSDHQNDGVASVAERQNAWAQIQELRQKAAARDAAAKTEVKS